MGFLHSTLCPQREGRAPPPQLKFEEIKTNCEKSVEYLRILLYNK